MYDDSGGAVSQSRVAVGAFGPLPVQIFRNSQFLNNTASRYTYTPPIFGYRAADCWEMYIY